MVTVTITNGILTKEVSHVHAYEVINSKVGKKTGWYILFEDEEVIKPVKKKRAGK